MQCALKVTPLCLSVEIVALFKRPFFSAEICKKMVKNDLFFLKHADKIVYYVKREDNIT